MEEAAEDLREERGDRVSLHIVRPCSCHQQSIHAAQDRAGNASKRGRLGSDFREGPMLFLGLAENFTELE